MLTKQQSKALLKLAYIVIFTCNFFEVPKSEKISFFYLLKGFIVIGTYYTEREEYYWLKLAVLSYKYLAEYIFKEAIQSKIKMHIL